jgi:hypothetical protein
VLVCLVILTLALVPIINLFTSIHRISHSSQRLVEASLHAQMLLEAVAEMDPEELDWIPDGGQAVIAQHGVASPASPGRQLPAFVAYFQRPPPVAGMERTVAATRLGAPGRELTIKVRVTWLGVVGEESTRQSIELSMLANPRSWQ